MVPILLGLSHYELDDAAAFGGLPRRFGVAELFGGRPRLFGAALAFGGRPRRLAVPAALLGGRPRRLPKWPEASRSIVRIASSRRSFSERSSAKIRWISMANQYYTFFILVAPLRPQ